MTRAKLNSVLLINRRKLAIARPSKAFDKLDYCQYLLSSQTNYILTNYAEHVTGVSHDLVRLFLQRERLTASDVWRQVKEDIIRSPEGFVSVSRTTYC
jgi:hypothetical protein